MPDFRCGCCQSRLEFIASLLWPILFSISRHGDSTRRAQSHALPGPSSSRPIFLHLASPSLPQPCRVQLVSTPSKLNFPTARSMILQTYKAKQSWLSMLRPSGRVVFKESPGNPQIDWLISYPFSYPPTAGLLLSIADSKPCMTSTRTRGWSFWVSLLIKYVNHFLLRRSILKLILFLFLFLSLSPSSSKNQALMKRSKAFALSIMA